MTILRRTTVPVRLLVLGLVCLGLPGQMVRPAAAQEQRPLTNDDVIRMVRAGLGEDTILAKIRATKGSFDTSVDGLIALKQAGVSDKIVKLMVGGDAPSGGDTAGGVVGGGLETGLYLDAAGEFTRLEPVPYSVKPGTFSYRYELRGSRASVTASAGRPTFVLALANAVGGLAFSGPAEFVLVRLDSKSDKREVKIDRKQTLPDVGLAFDYQDIGGRQYKITPKATLAAGEYAFVHMGVEKFFEFRIGASQAAKR